MSHADFVVLCRATGGRNGKYLGQADRLMQQRWARFAGSLQLPVVLCSVPAMPLMRSAISRYQQGSDSEDISQLEQNCKRIQIHPRSVISRDLSNMTPRRASPAVVSTTQGVYMHCNRLLRYCSKFLTVRHREQMTCSTHRGFRLSVLTCITNIASHSVVLVKLCRPIRLRCQELQADFEKCASQRLPLACTS